MSQLQRMHRSGHLTVAEFQALERVGEYLAGKPDEPAKRALSRLCETHLRIVTGLAQNETLAEIRRDLGQREPWMRAERPQALSRLLVLLG